MHYMYGLELLVGPTFRDLLPSPGGYRRRGRDECAGCGVCLGSCGHCGGSDWVWIVRGWTFERVFWRWFRGVCVGFGSRCRAPRHAGLRAQKQTLRSVLSPSVAFGIRKRRISMREVEIAVDGSCLGNPGPGGWACILRYGEHERVLQGGVTQTTNNRMEMTAAAQALRALSRPCDVKV